MSNEPNISNSEKYRQKRKERIAEKDAKKLEKNSKKSPTSKKTKVTIAVSLITIAILAVVLLLLNFFGVFTRATTALVTPSGEKVSMAEYELYYRNILTNYHNTAMQYEQSYGQYYGPGAGKMLTGYDYTKTPEKQKYTTGKLDEKYGKNPTWADYLDSISIQNAYMNRELAASAKKSGLKLSKDDQKQIDSTVEQMRKNAAENDMSLDAFFRENYGKGVNEKLFREVYKTEILANKYSEKKAAEFEKSVKEKDILNEYNKNKSKYDLTDVRIFSLSAASSTAKDDKTKATKSANDTKAKAQSMLDAITNEETFKQQAEKYKPKEQTLDLSKDENTLIKGQKKDYYSGNISKEAAEWLYNKDRKIGDKQIFEVEQQDGSVTYFILYVVKTSYQDQSHEKANVRHILISFDENLEDGKEVKVTDKLKAEKRKVAEDILNEWKNGKATEDSFAKLATKKSNDSGSAPDGGLIKDVTKKAQLVDPFKNWSLAIERKVGDTDIIESTYGYHIMYCSSVSKTPLWKAEIKSTLANNKTEKFFKDFMKETEKGSKINDKKIKKHQKVLDKYASNLVANTVKKEDQLQQQITKKSSSKTTNKKK